MLDMEILSQQSSLKGKWSTTRHTNDKLVGDVKALYILAQECTNGLAQEMADLALQCGQSQDAQYYINETKWEFTVL